MFVQFPKYNVMDSLILIEVLLIIRFYIALVKVSIQRHQNGLYKEGMSRGSFNKRGTNCIGK